MKNSNIKKVYWKGPWTIMPFPRQGCSIVYDGVKKTYDFYKGVPGEKTKPVNTLKKPERKIKQLDYWFYISLILTSILGIAIAVFAAVMASVIL